MNAHKHANTVQVKFNLVGLGAGRTALVEATDVDRQM